MDYWWFHKIKRTERGEIIRYDARLVAKGFKQVYRTDFVPIARMTRSKVLLFLTVQYDPHIEQFDVNTEFLNMKLRELIYDEASEYITRARFAFLQIKYNKIKKIEQGCLCC